MKIAAVVLSGLVINWLSDEVSVSPPILLLLAALALALLLAAERSATIHISTDNEYLGLAKLALLSLLVGAVVGAVWVMPIWNERQIETPWTGVLYNYELAAIVSITLLACVSAIRRRDVVLWMTYLGAAVAGMTLSIIYLKPSNDFMTTFVTWLAASGLVTYFGSNAPEMIRLFRAFLGFGSGGRRTNPRRER